MLPVFVLGLLGPVRLIDQNVQAKTVINVSRTKITDRPRVGNHYAKCTSLNPEQTVATMKNVHRILKLCENRTCA